MSKKIGLGIMSGTSFDGVDYVLCQFNEDQSLKFKKQFYTRYPKKLIAKIQKVAQTKSQSSELIELHFELGRFYSQSLKSFQFKEKLDFIALHGQTVFHAPPLGTLQIGHPHPLKAEFKCPVVYDFRSLDVAQGGQGAPLAPFFHEYFLDQTEELHFIQNIGGMSNVTYKTKGQLKAFDTGLGNAFIDFFMQEHFQKPFDKNGDFAQKGIPDYEFIESFYSKEKYFKKKAPKSCGREQFSHTVYKKLLQSMSKKKLSLENKAATLTELIVYCIVNQYKEQIKKTPHQVILCGGGAKNNYIKKRLQYHLPDSFITTSFEAWGWPETALEAGAFAYLGLLRINNQKLKLRHVTGGPNSVLGSIV